MRSPATILLLVVLGAAFATAIRWQTADGRTADAADAAGGTREETSPLPADLAAGGAAATAAAAPEPGDLDGPLASRGSAAERDVRHRAAVARAAAFAAWPVSSPRRGAAAAGSSGPSGTPAIPARIAFLALWYLGTDPEAEKTWLAAINDVNHPAGIRSDLIVDMIDEGYTDNDHPTAADLPVILARLELVERYAPFALDKVNADSFEEAYRHLLDLYVRLGGEPRERR